MGYKTKQLRTMKALASILNDLYFEKNTSPIFNAFFAFLIFLFSIVQGVAQCDSIPKITPDLWTHNITYITKSFINTETCERLSEYRYEFEDDCMPCELKAIIDQTEPFYITIADIKRTEVQFNETQLKPIEKYSDIAYYLIDPSDTKINRLEIKVWISNDIHFNISGFNRDFDFESYLEEDLHDHLKHRMVTYLFLGLLFASFMISFSSYFFSKSSDFKWYSLYVFVMFLFFLPRGIFSNEILGLENRDIQMITQPLVYVFYNLFTISFLKITKEQRILNFLLKAAIYLLIGFSALFIISIIWDLDSFKYSLWTVFRFSALTYASLTILFLFGIKSPLKYFILIGSLALIVGAALSMYFTQARLHPLGILPIHWMYYGTVAELFIFYAGIGYRINLEHIEKLNLSQNLVEEMEKNKVLQELRNEQLVKEIDIAEVKVKEEEKQKTDAQYELLLQKTEMQLLRAQMNPHFIFNSLNSIKSFIAKNEPRKATNFLNKFSKLIRLILNNSNSSSTTLKQEIQTLRFYLEVEQLRLDEDFRFQIVMDERLNAIEVQPLLIQPYVENAIWHGLVPKQGPKKLIITIETISGKRLKISIRDNGIGRVASQKFKSESHSKSKSHGMSITNSRITKGNQISSDMNKVDIIDHYDKQGNAQGTEVILLINYRENLISDEIQPRPQSPFS
jgi:sensor histidine kinase YesM